MARRNEISNTTHQLLSQSRSFRPVPSRSDLLSINLKDKRNGHHRNSNKAQQAYSPIYPEFLEHLFGEQREGSCEYAPDQRACCERACSIDLEGINKIIDRALEDAEEAESHQRCGETATNPVYFRIARPSKYEEANDEDDGSNHHGPQASFRNGFVVVSLELSDIESLVV